jgi:hypothetical protein
MRRSSFTLGKRGGDAQRAVMLSRLGIGEDVPEAAPPVRESLFNYHPPKAEPAPPQAPEPAIIEPRPRLYEVPRTEEPPAAPPVPAPSLAVSPPVELVQAEVAPAPPEAAPVNAELELMRAELAAIRQQFTAPPIAAPRKRRRKRVDVVKGVRQIIWLLAIVGAALVAFNMLKTPEGASPKQDHLLAAAVGG